MSNIERVIALEAACRAAMPCLEDWIKTTSFGEINRRDKAALKLIKDALAIATDSPVMVDSASIPKEDYVLGPVYTQPLWTEEDFKQLIDEVQGLWHQHHTHGTVFQDRVDKAVNVSRYCDIANGAANDALGNDRVLLMGKDWEQCVKPDTLLGFAHPVFTNTVGDKGRVLRAECRRYSADMDRVRACKQPTDLPHPVDLGKALARVMLEVQINPIASDSRDCYYWSGIQLHFKLEDFWINMFAHAHYVEFIETKTGAPMLGHPGKD